MACLLRLVAAVGITTSEAKKFIDAYSENIRRPRIHRCTLEQAPRRAKSVRCSDAFAPFRHQQQESNQRGFAERTAVNTPLQGTAADLIKLAMIRIDEEIRQRGLKSPAIDFTSTRQIVFEVPESEVDTMSRCARAHGAGDSLAFPLLGNRSGTELAGHGVSSVPGKQMWVQAEENYPASCYKLPLYSSQRLSQAPRSS